MAEPLDSARVIAREKAAVAHALNLADDQRAASKAELLTLLSALPSGEGNARIGFTGPPGVGKSSLVAVLARAWRAANRSVGVIAIDPSSVRSGGALLGDRVRIAPEIPDPDLFVRSVATRGDAGGLARTVPTAVRILASVYERTIVETVGVGQNETDVRDVVDTVVLVVQPGSGDALQFLKAGIMEVPDVLVVNKADHEALSRTAQAELRSAVHALMAADIGSSPQILRTSARDGTGVGELLALLEARHADLIGRGELGALRRGQRIRQEERAFVRAYGELGVRAIGGETALRERIVRAIDEGTALPALDFAKQP